MVKITKVTTKTGDKGHTKLAAGKCIDKSSIRIEAIGYLDELNAHIGFAAVSINFISQLTNLYKQIIRIQHELFDLGAQLAVLAEDRRASTPIITVDCIEALEDEINQMNLLLPTLRSFVLPGGNEHAARLHIARTICRHAERSVIRLAEHESLDGVEIPYLNRLSDWLFVASRFTLLQLNVKEILWNQQINKNRQS
jgi:cob(I)alamin adenosyltransferase